MVTDDQLKELGSYNYFSSYKYNRFALVSSECPSLKHHLQSPLCAFKLATYKVFRCYFFSVVFHHIFLSTVSLDVEFICFINIFTFLSHFISCLPRVFLPYDHQVHTSVGHVLSPMRNKCAYHFNMLFSVLSRIVCVTAICLRLLPFLILIFLMFLQLFPKNPFLYLTVLF